MANDQALKGVANVIAQLRDIGKLDDGKALRAGVRAGMRPALLAARVKIPISKKPHRLSKTYGSKIVQPGYAKSTLRVITTVSPDKQKAAALMSTRKPAFYATVFVELGTKYITAQPWLRPAFYSTQEQQKQALAAKLNAYLLKVSANKGGGNTPSDP